MFNLVYFNPHARSYNYSQTKYKRFTVKIVCRNLSFPRGFKASKWMVLTADQIIMHIIT